MNTPNNAAALERIEHYACTLRLHSDVGVAGAMAHKISDELLDIIEELRTLTQPDALTSQPSGEAVRWEFLMVPVERPNNPIPSRAAWTPCTKSEYDDMRANPAAGDWRYEVRALYAHPSADAPGVAVDEAMATRAIFARNEYLNRHPGEALGAMHAALTAALAPKPEGGHAD